MTSYGVAPFVRDHNAMVKHCERKDVLLKLANDALAAAIHVLMRPCTIEVDAEVHEARMACILAQDAIARAHKPPEDAGSDGS